MATKRSIEILVSPNGDVSIEAVSFKGADCEKATRYLEEALGVINRRVRKPEYSCNAKTNNQQQVSA